MPTSTQNVKRYRVILANLEKPFAQNVGEDKLYETFRSQLLREFRLQITFDSDISEALKQFFKDVLQRFLGKESFNKKLRFMAKINQMLYQRHFISLRDYARLRDHIKKEQDSPINLWLQELDYIQKASDQAEFRNQFLTRYINLPEAEANELIEGIQNDTDCEKKLKAYYETFFQRCVQENVSLKVVNYIEDAFSKFQNKAEMLEPATLKTLQKKLGVNVGSNDQQIKINSMLVELAQNNCYLNDQKAQQRLDNQIRLLEKALQKFSGLNILKEKKIVLRLGKFGSIMSGFAGVDADLDLTILTNCYVPEVELLKLLQEFMRKQYKEDDRSSGRRVSIELIATARTPLVAITVCEKGESDIKIDIIVNNILGVINSKFLSKYAQVRWIKNLGLLVKMWGKAKGMIGKSMLSSYAIILMLIHYLIREKKINPIIDGRIQQKQMPHFKYKRIKASQVEQFDVYYFFKANAEDVTTCQRVNYLKILQGFMKYYAQDIWKNNGVEVLHPIITVDQSYECPIDKECVITIKDPFDQPHNPGRVKIDTKQFFKQRFKEAYTDLKEGKLQHIKQLFIR